MPCLCLDAPAAGSGTPRCWSRCRYKEGKNPLTERCQASMAVSGGRLFIRTDRHLYCIRFGAAKATKSRVRRTFQDAVWRLAGHDPIRKPPMKLSFHPHAVGPHGNHGQFILCAADKPKARSARTKAKDAERYCAMPIDHPDRLSICSIWSSSRVANQPLAALGYVDVPGSRSRPIDGKTDRLAHSGAVVFAATTRWPASPAGHLLLSDTLSCTQQLYGGQREGVWRQSVSQLQ